MESLKCLIDKIKRFDYNYIDIIPELDTRLNVVCQANDIISELFKKKIVDVEFTSATKANVQILLYIATIIFKKSTVVYDFKNYIEPCILKESTNYLESSIYANRFEQLVKNNQNIIDTNQSIMDIDVVFGSGGQAGLFALGICDIINKLKYCNICRVSGVSIGAWVALFYLAKFDTTILINLYLQINALHTSGEYTNMRLSEYYYEAWGSYLKNLVDVDFYKTCNNRLFIGYTELTSTGAKFNVKSNYSSNDDLLLTCIASSAIPFMSIDGMCVIMDGKKTLDGNLLHGKYFFNDNKRDQLYIKASSIEYNPKYLLSPTDTNIDKLIHRGAAEMVSFLETDQSTIISLIKN
jgi:hypothetical protein